MRVELDRRSAILTGPRLRDALELTGARWHWHEASRHKAIRVHLDDADDVIAALELDGLRVEILDRDGWPVAAGGLLGVA